MSTVLMPALMLGAAGALTGLILGIVAKYFAVEGEQLTEDIKAVLPGMNCGVCGFAGCGDYAKALATGEESTYNLCTPGKEKSANAIKALLTEEGLL